jgi:hypothetical protein
MSDHEYGQPRWEFRQRSQAEVNRDPNDDQFFRTQETIPALLREVIQNSLDATRDEVKQLAGLVDEGAEVRFVLSGGRWAAAEADAAPWLEGIVPNLRANGIDIPKGRVPFLLIEDFNTTGLTGNPEPLTHLLDEENNNNFRFFWRWEGRSGKGEQSRGSWGLGKSVFSASSLIQSYWGLTVQDGKLVKKNLLMGKSVLKIHQLREEGCTRDAAGYFGRHHNTNHFQMPLGGVQTEDDAAYMAEFRKTFRLKRAIDDPGLSVVVPFPVSEFDNSAQAADVMIRETLRHFYHAVATGLLKVSIEYVPEDASELLPTTIDQESLLDMADMAFQEVDVARSGKRLAALIELAKLENEQIVAHANEKQTKVHFFELTDPHPTKAPDLGRLSWQPGQLEIARQSYADGFPLIMKVPISVQRKTRNGKNAPNSSELTITLRKAIDHRNAAVDYIRHGMKIISEKQPAHAVQAIVLAQDSAIASLLRDAENPAHTNWLSTTRKLKECYVNGASRVKAVKSVVKFLVEQMLDSKTRRNVRMLADVFPRPGSNDELEVVPTKKRRKRRGTSDTQPKVRKEYWQLKQNESGFQLGPGEHSEELNTQTVVLRAAYDIGESTKSAMAKYSKHDFTWEALKLDYSGIEPLSAVTNRFEFRVNSPHFVLSVSGFDTNRDLRVDIRRKS